MLDRATAAETPSQPSFSNGVDGLEETASRHRAVTDEEAALTGHGSDSSGDGDNRATVSKRGKSRGVGMIIRFPSRCESDSLWACGRLQTSIAFHTVISRAW